MRNKFKRGQTVVVENKSFCSGKVEASQTGKVTKSSVNRWDEIEIRFNKSGQISGIGKELIPERKVREATETEENEYYGF